MKFPKFRRRNDNYDEEFFGLYGDDSDYGDSENDGIDEDIVDDGYTAPANEKDGNAFEMKIITPKSYDDREDIARCLVNGSAVFLNIEALSRDSVIRLMDYLGGVIYVIDGKVKWSNSSSVIFAPRNVNISGLDDEASDEEAEDVIDE